MIAHVIAVLCTVVLYVDCNSKVNGSDGSLNKPFKSVEEVCSKLYSYQEDVVVKFYNGFYEIKEDIELNNVNNVVFESLEKNKPALFTNSVKIGKDMIVDSKEIPIVCYNDEFATLARWPNKDFKKFKETDNETYFKYTCSKFNKIDFEKENVYVCGYLAAEWLFDMRRIKSYKNSIVKLDMPKSPGEWKGDGRGRFYICNLKSELDYPGEYYWNPDTKIVSFVKPKIKIDKFVTCPNSNSIMTLNNCSNVVFKDIVFQYCKSHGVRLFNCEKCIVDSCVFKTIKECGVMVIGGNSCVITNSSMYNTVSGGIVMKNCGDRKNLISCNHIISNCRIDSRSCKTVSLRHNGA